ncbi:MAG: hypothetical protein QG573_767 [Acidobacteriota bacterium]|nr:hypothetical protein [Acidobacteriota bacterium]
MRGFRSVRERRLWVAVAVAVSLLLAALYPFQLVLDALRARNLLRLSIAGLFLVVAVPVVYSLARRRAPLRAWIVLAAAGAVYLVLAVAMEVPQERLHLVEYGALAILLRAAFAESAAVRPRGAHSTIVDLRSLLAATAIGWLDEAMQGILPNRMYDLRDVGFNALSAAVALGAAAALRVAIEPAARSREEPEK